MMKNKIVSKIVMACFVGVLFINIYGADNEFEILKNYKGYGIPNIRDYNLVNSREQNVIINNVKKEIVLKTYQLVNENSIKYRDVVIADLKNDFNGDKCDSVRFWVKDFTACYLKSNDELLYYDLSMITDDLSESKIIKDSLFHRKHNGRIDSESFGSITSYRSYFGTVYRAISFDSDSDGKFESLFFFPIEVAIENESVEDFLARDLNMIVNYVSHIKSDMLPFEGLVHAWSNYRKKTTPENAEIFLKAIPDESVDKTGICFHPDFLHLKKQFERGDSKEKFLTSDEKKIWIEIESNLDFIKRQAYLGEPNAVRILFKLYRIFYKSYLFQSKLDLIMDELSLIKTDLFLEVLKENLNLDLFVLLDMYIGFDFLNKTNERYENLKTKIMIFKRTNNPDLTKIRDECLNVLNQLKTEIEKSGLLAN